MVADRHDVAVRVADRHLLLFRVADRQISGDLLLTNTRDFCRAYCCIQVNVHNARVLCWQTIFLHEYLTTIDYLQWSVAKMANCYLIFAYKYHYCIFAFPYMSALVCSRLFNTASVHLHLCPTILRNTTLYWHILPVLQWIHVSYYAPTVGYIASCAFIEVDSRTW